MKVKAKFQCHSITLRNGGSTQVNLGAVTAMDGETEAAKLENAKFWSATPSGTVELHISNPSAAEFFQPGKPVYLTFERIDES